jgi:hypothetical protein
MPHDRANSAVCQRSFNSRRFHHFCYGVEISGALGSATTVLANEFRGLLKETVKVSARKRRFEPTFLRNDFISSQVSSGTHFSA